MKPNKSEPRRLLLLFIGLFVSACHTCDCDGVNASWLLINKQHTIKRWALQKLKAKGAASIPVLLEAIRYSASQHNIERREALKQAIKLSRTMGVKEKEPQQDYVSYLEDSRISESGIELTQRLAAESLVDLGEVAVPHVLPLLESRHYSERLVAFEVLGKIGNPSILPYLDKYISLDDLGLQTGALLARDRMGSN